MPTTNPEDYFAAEMEETKERALAEQTYPCEACPSSSSTDEELKQPEVIIIAAKSLHQSCDTKTSKLGRVAAGDITRHENDSEPVIRFAEQLNEVNFLSE